MRGEHRVKSLKISVSLDAISAPSTGFPANPTADVRYCEKSHIQSYLKTLSQVSDEGGNSRLDAINAVVRRTAVAPYYSCFMYRQKIDREKPSVLQMVDTISNCTEATTLFCVLFVRIMWLK